MVVSVFVREKETEMKTAEESEVPEKPQFRLGVFEVELPRPGGGNVVDNGVYVGGRQQCQVDIIVQKEQRNEAGRWFAVPLEDHELESATLVEYSNDKEATLPKGWSCDTERNRFVMGPWAGRLEGAGSETDYSNPIIQPIPGIGPLQNIKRYLRFEKGNALNQKFMAKIVIGKTTYITNMAGEEDEIPFQSSVTLTPREPYVLPAERLEHWADTGALTEYRLDVDIYYWSPPLGLRFVENIVPKNAVKLLDPTVQGDKYAIYYTHDVGSGIRQIGGVIPGNTVNNITMNDLLKKTVGQNKEIIANKRNTIMRAARVKAWLDNPDVDRQGSSIWTLVDNYGCEHHYFLSWADNRNVLQLVSTSKPISS
jgi:hypothetical protein